MITPRPLRLVLATFAACAALLARPAPARADGPSAPVAPGTFALALTSVGVPIAVAGAAACHPWPAFAEVAGTCAPWLDKTP